MRTNMVKWHQEDVIILLGFFLFVFAIEISTFLMIFFIYQCFRA